ncbi:MAG: hypothetical protein ACK4PR_10615 [Gammaproteobacteria bacterium]
MTQASSTYLTHPYPIWEGCTLGEIGLVSGVSLGMCFVSLLLLGILFHHVHLFLLGMVPAFILVPKLAVRRLAALKKDRPYGFVMIHCRLLGEKYLGIGTPYLSRIGRWSTKQ